MADGDEAQPLDGFEDVPSNLISLIEHVGLVTDHLEGDSLTAYEPLTQGKCMTCGSKLGELTVLFVHTRGIVAGYCSGPCIQDMAVLGWIQEQHDDIVDGINFRGGRGDVAE